MVQSSGLKHCCNTLSVQTMDPHVIMGLLHSHPFHVDSLLLLSTLLLFDVLCLIFPSR